MSMVIGYMLCYVSDIIEYDKRTPELAVKCSTPHDKKPSLGSRCITIDSDSTVKDSP